MPSCFTRRLLGPVLLAAALPVHTQDSAPAATNTAPELVADMDNATTIWDNACSACHGELGQGVDGAGSDIRNTILSLSQIMLVVKAGRNTMPGFSGFTQQELLDIGTYVKEEL